MAASSSLDKRTIPVSNKNSTRRLLPYTRCGPSPGVGQDITFLQGRRRPWPPSPGALNSWLAWARKTLLDLCWLLRLPCHRFWSQVCNDGLHMWLGELLEVFQREQDRENSWHLTIQQTNYNILSSLDISFTMSSMVSVFSPSSSPLHQTGLEVKLAMFYTNVVTL